ncbi:MAG: class II aldolase/adducin family protein [Coriobacteriia bacterium]|nr:class II aldolase/adducin family protein [Coriobacteriia bacterium]
MSSEQTGPKRKKANPDMHVLRAKSRYSQLIADTYRRIPPVLDDMAQIVGVSVPVIEVNDQRRLGKILTEGGACIVKKEGYDAELLAVGATPAHATAALTVLEKTCKVFWEAEQLGGARPLNPVEAWLMHQIYQRKYSQMESMATHQSAEDFDREIGDEEMLIRQEIVDAGKEMLEKNLVQGTWGNISVQLDDQYMLVTPSGLEYDRLTPYDIVRVDMHTMEHEGNLTPTSEKIIHAELLKSKDDVSCIIHSHPVNSSSFAAAHQPVRADDEASHAVLGGDVEVAKYGLPGSKKLAQNVIAAINENRACIMENHGMLVCGVSLEDTLEKCQTLERLAQQNIENLPIQDVTA